MTDQYAVFGNPIAHSKSPEIHRLFAEQTGQDMRYDKQLVELGGFAQAATAFFAAGGRGLNVTLPFKEDAFRFAHRKTDRARQAGAVNTLSQTADGLVLGDNTDGAGLLRDLQVQLGWQVAGARVLVLGAGGAVRGVLGPLLAASPRQLVLVNRTPDRARNLARAFAGQGPVESWRLDALAGQEFDLIINGTSAGLADQGLVLPEELVTADTCVYDMMYGAEPTAFLRWAMPRARACADGLGMLVAQAAEAFYLWRGVKPDAVAVLQRLRRELAGAV